MGGAAGALTRRPARCTPAARRSQSPGSDQKAGSRVVPRGRCSVQETAGEPPVSWHAAGFCGACPAKSAASSGFADANPALNTKTARISMGASGGKDGEILHTTQGVKGGSK